MKAKRIALLIFTCLMALAACGGETIDIGKTADNILATVSFDDELIKAESSVVNNLYSLPSSGIEDSVIYVSSSGATANEFAIFKIKDNAAASAVKTALASRIDTLTVNFENYVPDELNRIGSALIVQKGDYILFAVTYSNEDIQDIFNNAFK